MKLVDSEQKHIHKMLALGGVKIYELVWFYRKNSNDLRGVPCLVPPKTDPFQEEQETRINPRRLTDAGVQPRRTLEARIQPRKPYDARVQPRRPQSTTRAQNPIHEAPGAQNTAHEAPGTQKSRRIRK